MVPQYLEELRLVQFGRFDGVDAMLVKQGVRDRLNILVSVIGDFFPRHPVDQLVGGKKIVAPFTDVHDRLDEYQLRAGAINSVSRAMIFPSHGAGNQRYRQQKVSQSMFDFRSHIRKSVLENPDEYPGQNQCPEIHADAADRTGQHVNKTKRQQLLRRRRFPFQEARQRPTKREQEKTVERTVREDVLIVGEPYGQRLSGGGDQGLFPGLRHGAPKPVNPNGGAHRQTDLSENDDIPADGVPEKLDHAADEGGIAQGAEDRWRNRLPVDSRVMDPVGCFPKQRTGTNIAAGVGLGHGAVNGKSQELKDEECPK